MSGYVRAVHPLDPDAVAAANAAVAPETGGRPLRMDEYELRKKWMAAYEAAGGKVETVESRGKAPDEPCESCKTPKSITAKIVTVTFLSDHLDAGGKKLIKRAVSEPIKVKVKTGVDASTGAEISNVVDVDSVYGDKFTEFKKPEWDEARGGSSDSHPISHTKDQNVRVKIQIEFTVTPKGETGVLTHVKGDGTDPYLTFEQSLSKTVGTGRVEVTGFVSAGKLPNFVTRLEGSIQWTAEVDGETKDIGTTGSHVIYVTFLKPFGKMASPVNNAFQETGADQVVTEDRLKYSVNAADSTGVTDEQECVDAIFVNMMKLGVNYILSRRWENAPLNNTGVLPKPSLHHYLWLCDAAIGQGECHNIAAAMAVACRIIGVQGAFEVGYMYPWPSRSENHPTYSKSGLTTSGQLVAGKYNVRYSRDHSVETGHGTQEFLGFLDGRGFGNNFEGVVAYKGVALYAIGDDIFDTSTSDANVNATSYYVKRDLSAGIRRPILDWDKGLFDLVFWQNDGTVCDKPYPWLTTPTSYPNSGRSYVKFRWED